MASSRAFGQRRTIIDNPSRPLLFATRDRLGTSNRMNRRQFGRIAAVAAAFPFTPALAQRVDKYAEQLTNGEFNWYPGALGERSDHRHCLAARSAGVCLSQWGPHRRLVLLDRQTRPPNADGRVQDPAEGQEPPFLDLQQCADALHEPAHMVWNRAARRAVAWLPRVAWMRAPAEGFRGTPVRRHQARHDGGHRRREVTARRSDASRHGARRICRARIQRRRQQRSRRPNIRKGTIPRRNRRASSSAAPTSRSGCSTMAPWRLPARSRFRIPRSRSASVCSP